MNVKNKDGHSLVTKKGGRCFQLNTSDTSEQVPTQKITEAVTYHYNLSYFDEHYFILWNL